jgi:hypothetical protein
MNIVQRILRKVYRTTAGPLNLVKMKKMGMQFFDPNYVYFGGLNESSVIVDVGCGYEAEFSKHLIDKYNLEAFGVDPTRKHAPFFKKNWKRAARAGFTILQSRCPRRMDSSNFMRVNKTKVVRFYWSILTSRMTK